MGSSPLPREFDTNSLDDPLHKAAFFLGGRRLVGRTDQQTLLDIYSPTTYVDGNELTYLLCISGGC